MRMSSVIMHAFWTRGAGRPLRAKKDAQVLAFYLLSCPYDSITGLFCLAMPTIAFETGLTAEEITSAFELLSAIDLAHYDEAEGVVYLPDGMVAQVGETISRTDKRVPAIVRELRAFSDHPFLSDLLLKYGESHSAALGQVNSDPGLDRKGLPGDRKGLPADRKPLKSLTLFKASSTDIANSLKPREPAHAQDGESGPASASQIRVVAAPAVQAPPGRVETAMPGQEALDPVPAPPTPQGVAAIGMQPRPLPASESRLMGSVWIEAYERAARDTWDYPRWTFEPRQLSTLDRVISTQCETPDRARICDWIHRTVVEFAKAIGDKRQFWAGGQPAGLEKWFNCGKPAEKALSASPVTRADIESAMHPSRRKFKKDGTYAD